MLSVTLKTISKHFNVSIATVSRILSNPDYNGKSAALSASIRHYAESLNYSPNTDAVSLKKSSLSTPSASTTICCFFARAITSEENQFFLEVLRSVEQQAMNSNCALGFKFTRLEMDELFLDRSNGADKKGLVIIGRPSYLEFSNIMEDLNEFYDGNLVFTGLHYIDKPCDQVICNGYHAATLALEYLYSLNHRSIVYVGETGDEIRYTSYLNFMKAKGLPILPNQIIECSMTISGGYSIARRIMDMRDLKPTAVFCANDITAAGLLNGLTELGIDIPRELSVISVDNIELAQSTKPMLTTIQIPTDALGKFAVKLLVSRMKGEHSRNVRVHLPCSLIKRESCESI